MHAPSTELPTASRTSPTARWSLPGKLTEIFGIDVRSLAAFRIAMGGLLLLNLWNRFQDLTAFYTDAGVLPRIQRIALFQYMGQDEVCYPWSLHMLNGSAWSQTILFLVQALFAVWLLVGYRTRLATFASWLLLVSLDSRNPLLEDAGDRLWEAMLFWSFFVPLGTAYSIDSRLRPPLETPPQRIFSFGVVALQLQLCLVYFCSAIFKMNPMWSQDFTAIYYAMSQDNLTTRFGQMLLNYPQVMKVLTCSTLGLELIGPWLSFMPFWNGKFRLAAVLMFWGLHLGIVATIELGMFPWICIACWLLFLPGGVWNTIGGSRLWGKVSSAFLQAISPHLNPRLFRNPERPRWILSRTASCLAALLFGVVVFWNIREFTPEGPKLSLAPTSFNTLVRTLALDQRWSLFMPDSLRNAGWLEMEGTLRDGSVVNLWQIGEPLPTTKPDLVSRTYVSQRWRKYLLTLMMKPYVFHKPYFADWLRRRWDEQMAADNPKHKVAKIRLIYHVEFTPLPGQEVPGPDDLVWTWRDPEVPDASLDAIPPPVLPSDEPQDEKPAVNSPPREK